MSSDVAKHPFGGALIEAVQAVEAQGGAALSVDAAGTKFAFLDGWTRALTAYARRLRSAGTHLSAPVMLVYVEDTGKFAASTGWKTNPLLGTAPTDNLAGLLAAGTAECGGCVYPQRLSETSDFAAEAERVGLGRSLTIALTGTTCLYVWPEGILAGKQPNAVDLSEAPTVIDLAKIELELDRFYYQEARQSTKWWRDADQRITVNQPERAVQDTLRLFLGARLYEVAKVREEIVSGNGRMDITIEATNGCVLSAVLELKTVRDLRTPQRAGNTPIPISLKTNVRWAQSGVQQAAAYRDKEQFTNAFLCLYDFCKTQGSSIEAKVAVPAARYSVRVKRYWITASHDEHRNSAYPIAPLSAQGRGRS